MGEEIDLLKNYPKANRDLSERLANKTERVRQIARKFGKDFFDGDRDYGYGGFNYSPRFWEPVVPTFKEHFQISKENSVLDVGCAKGFMMFDFSRLIPGLTIKGIDISQYAIENAMEEMKPHVQVANAKCLPFDNDSFDFVISINTIHNLERSECALAVREIERVSRLGSFITVDAYRSEEEKERMFAWNLTAKTIMSVEEWEYFFKELDYTGDRFWFLP